MLFDIHHHTTYTFSRPVFLEPHTLRFRPRVDGSQSLDAFELAIVPQPMCLTETLDAEGNAVAVAWFTGLHERLSVTARTRVRTHRDNPFDYLLNASATSLPFQYPAPMEKLLAPARQRSAPLADSDPVHALAERLREQSADVPTFLNSLNGALYADFEVIYRESGDPWEAAATLARRQGSCRDLAVLFIDACRAMGLAARFVSGYQEGDPNQTERDLHAWAEVYLPGGGWRGYDPTHGLVVSDRHVPIAAAADSADAAPVVGTLRGTGATATLTAEISIRVQEAMRFPRQQQQQGA